MRLITTSEDLAAFAQEVSASDFVAIDTEFMRETTYWPKLCLIQVAGGPSEAIIDPLAPAMDLSPLWPLMSAPNVLKVFHAARQDLEIFLNLAGTLPSPLFDSQIGAMACGLGDSIAYDALVQAMLKRRVDKSHRFTDWSRRPLSNDQLTYALADVTHLRDLYPLMRAKLEETGRAKWVDEEHRSLLAPQNYDTEPENAWMRLRLRKQTPEYLATLKAAAAWRERNAQGRDVPRGRILKDDALYEIAEHAPKNAAAFERMRAVPRGFGNSRMGAELIAAIETALVNPVAYAPKVDRPPPSPPNGGSTVELLKVLLRFEAERHGVAPRLIASVADLELIAASDKADTPALEGWRREVFGERALALKQGRIALSLERGRVVVRE